MRFNCFFFSFALVLTIDCLCVTAFADSDGIPPEDLPEYTSISGFTDIYDLRVSV